jgi:hypothetical protein
MKKLFAVLAFALACASIVAHADPPPPGCPFVCPSNTRTGTLR